MWDWLVTSKKTRYECNQMCISINRRNSSNGNCFTIENIGMYENAYKSVKVLNIECTTKN